MTQKEIDAVMAPFRGGKEKWWSEGIYIRCYVVGILLILLLVSGVANVVQYACYSRQHRTDVALIAEQQRRAEDAQREYAIELEVRDSAKREIESAVSRAGEIIDRDSYTVKQAIEAIHLLRSDIETIQMVIDYWGARGVFVGAGFGDAVGAVTKVKE